ncbi:hypothetical protein R6L23_27210, partial [Streptomyces sp. SR27]|nr:hypothetical protein [Streptomyces sp. SR27]
AQPGPHALPQGVPAYAPPTPPSYAGNHSYGSPEQHPPVADAPLPRRVRQASLVDELRIAPTPAPAATPAPPLNWQDDPLLRPVPRRASATIGAFQRRSRATRTHTDQDTGQLPAPGSAPEPPAPTRTMREEERS